MSEKVWAGESPLFDRRPWGTFTVLDEGAGYKVKRIEVLPGKRLSYQRHAQRAEHWFVVSGTARVTLDDREIDAPAGTLVFVRDPHIRRKAVADEADTAVLAVGAQPGVAFEPSPWELRLVGAPDAA